MTTKPQDVGDLTGGGRIDVRRWLGAVGPLLVLMLVFVFFSALMPRQFPSPGNVETMARHTTVVGIAAIGMTVVLISGGIDLSVGSVITLSVVVVAWLLNHGIHPLLSALGGVAAGTLCGLANGLLITRLKVVPFIVTLGMMLVVKGAAKCLANNVTICPPEKATAALGPLMQALPADLRWMLVPTGVWAMVLLAAIVAAMLRYTRLGRHVFAVGSNEMSARLCGVPVDSVKVKAYAIGATFAGTAGVMLFSKLSTGDPTAALGQELAVIAAAVIGGGSFSGGEGSVFGSIAGAVVMTAIATGCRLMLWPDWVQEVVTGAVIVGALAVDRLRHWREG